jgi:hypothetical protein
MKKKLKVKHYKQSEIFNHHYTNHQHINKNTIKLKIVCISIVIFFSKTRTIK